MKQNQNNTLTYVVSIAIPLIVGAVSALLTRNAMMHFESLIQPPLSPPAWLFPVVWTVLFTLMGISAAMIYLSNNKEKGDALFIYGVQLAVNFLWPVFYFSFGARLLAFFWLLFLLALVAAMTNRFLRINEKAGKLQIPYIIWLVFAAYLNMGTYLLNM